MSTKFKLLKSKICSPFAAISKRWESLSTKKQLLVKAIFALAILVCSALLFVHFKAEFYEGQTSISKKKFLFFVGSFFLYIFCLFVKNPFNEKWNGVINTLALLFTPLACFIMTEYAMDTGLNFKKIQLLRFALNIVIYALVMLLPFALTLSTRFSLPFVALVSTLFGITNIYLISFRQIPLLVSDFSVMGTAANVASSYDYTITLPIFLLILFFFDVFAISRRLKDDVKLKKNWKLRILALVIYILVVCGFWHITVKTDFLKNNHISVNTFRPIKSYYTNGGALTMVRSIKLCIVEKPDGYSTSAVEEIAENYTSDSASETGDATTPNVIVIMDEAFSDLQSVGDFETNEEVLPFYNSLTENTIKGFAYVSVFGGQTANTEYEFLTGDSKAFLPSGSTPYQLYIKSETASLTSTLNALSYCGMIAMHPYQGSGYNRINVYNNFGFSRFITVDDFAQTAEELVRNFISDETDFSRIISEYEAAQEESDEPFYLFNVTMQNHSPYDTDFDNLPDTIQITTESAKDDDAERYLNLIHLSDAALEELITYFEGVDEPTVIVFFGDHEPGLSDAFYESILGQDPNTLTSEESMELYKVPYLIWANYDIEEQTDYATSINYLESIMAEACGLPQTGYNKFLLELSESVPIITGNGYFGADGNFYTLDDTSSPYYELLQQYNILEYNHLFGGSNTSSIFSLAE